MKKMLTAVLMICILALASVFWLVHQGFSVSSGIYLQANNASHIVLLDKTPVIMSAQNVTFHGLQSGNRIFVLHDGIEESYPARTGVYFLLKISQTSAVDKTVLQQLTELGWYVDYPPVKCINGG